MRATRYRTGSLALAAALLLLTVTSCEHDPVGADAFTDAPCGLPVIPASFEGQAVGSPALRDGLADAATRSSAGLENRSHTDDLVQALGYLSHNLDGGSPDASCRMLGLAMDALGTQDGLAEGPDRAAIELVLNLATAALRTQP